MQDMNLGKEVSPHLEHREPRKLSRYRVPPRPSQIVEPRCGVCQHDHRSFIETMIIKGISYKRIEETVSPKVSRQSISNHYKKHMDLQDAALRSIIEREAEIQGINHEEGVEDLLTGRAVLETALRRGHDALLDKSAKVEAKDIVQIVRVLADMDEGREQVSLEAARLQVNIFMQAIKDVVPLEMQTLISERVAILRAEDPLYAQYRGDSEVVVDAEVVEYDTLEDGDQHLQLPTGE